MASLQALGTRISSMTYKDIVAGMGQPVAARQLELTGPGMNEEPPYANVDYTPDVGSSDEDAAPPPLRSESKPREWWKPSLPWRPTLRPSSLGLTPLPDEEIAAEEAQKNKQKLEAANASSQPAAGQSWPRALLANAAAQQQPGPSAPAAWPKPPVRNYDSNAKVVGHGQPWPEPQSDTATAAAAEPQQQPQAEPQKEPYARAAVAWPTDDALVRAASDAVASGAARRGAEETGASGQPVAAAGAEMCGGGLGLGNLTVKKEVQERAADVSRDWYLLTEAVAKEATLEEEGAEKEKEEETPEGAKKERTAAQPASGQENPSAGQAIASSPQPAAQPASGQTDPSLGQGSASSSSQPAAGMGGQTPWWQWTRDPPPTTEATHQMQALKARGPKRGRYTLDQEDSALCPDSPEMEQMKEHMRWSVRMDTLTWRSANEGWLKEMNKRNVSFWKAFQYNDVDEQGVRAQTKYQALLSKLPAECYEKFPLGMEGVTDAKRVAQLFIHYGLPQFPPWRSPGK